MKQKKRNKETREKHLSIIAKIEITEPLIASNINSFISHIAKKLKLTPTQAKKDIEEVRKRKVEMNLIDLKAELAKKKSEYAYIKQIALKTKNINAYLGAVNKEAEMLSLEKFTIFSQMQEKEEEKSNSLEEKKSLLFNKLFPKKD
ncbi:MAG: hypothetical protein ACTTKH_04475 [Treponema sp.]